MSLHLRAVEMPKELKKPNQKEINDLKEKGLIRPSRRPWKVEDQITEQVGALF